MASQAFQRQRPVTKEPTALGSLARVYWMLGGYLFLGVCAASITTSQSTLSLRDLGFWAAAASLVVVRYVDVARFHGTTAEGEPATISHWRRCALVVAAGATALWFAAHRAALVAGR